MTVDIDANLKGFFSPTAFLGPVRIVRLLFQLLPRSIRGGRNGQTRRQGSSSVVVFAARFLPRELGDDAWICRPLTEERAGVVASGGGDRPRAKVHVEL